MHITDTPKLSELTTIRLGGRAIALVEPETRDDLEHLGSILDQLGGIPFILGRGSNLIAEDGNLPYVLVRPLPYGKPTIVGESGERTLVRTDASFPMPRLIAWAAKHGLTGLAPLTGIPGEVGGAFNMNAGSYGATFGDFISSIELFSLRTGFHSIDRGELDFAYRKASYPTETDPSVVIAVTMALGTGSTRELRLESRTTLQRKRMTQPIHEKSAGCAFRNPAGISAGKLLDEAGFRGKSCGGMMFSPLHANFLVNTGRGTSEQAFALLKEAREAVKARTGIDLGFEIRILAC